MPTKRRESTPRVRQLTSYLRSKRASRLSASFGHPKREGGTTAPRDAKSTVERPKKSRVTRVQTSSVTKFCSGLISAYRPKFLPYVLETSIAKGDVLPPSKSNIGENIPQFTIRWSVRRMRVLQRWNSAPATNTPIPQTAALRNSRTVHRTGRRSVVSPGEEPQEHTDVLP